MTLEEYLVSIVAPLVNYPDKIVIDSSSDDMGVLFNISLDASDMGTVIGKGGETAKCIRTLMRVAGMRQHARVSVKISEPEGSTYKPKPKTDAELFT